MDTTQDFVTKSNNFELETGTGHYNPENHLSIDDYPEELWISNSKN